MCLTGPTLIPNCRALKSIMASSPRVSNGAGRPGNRNVTAKHAKSAKRDVIPLVPKPALSEAEGVRCAPGAKRSGGISQLLVTANWGLETRARRAQLTVHDVRITVYGVRFTDCG
jgi:hypothetical protein